MNDRKVSGDRGHCLQNILAPRCLSAEPLPCWVFGPGDDTAADCFHGPRGFEKMVLMD